MSTTVTAQDDRAIVITRAFGAPRALVWEAWTTPELLKRWLGLQHGWTLPVCEMDLRVGGGYRYVWRGPKGQDMGMHGTFREIGAPELLVSVESFDDPWYEGEGHVTTRFTEVAGRTTVTMVLRFDTTETRDMVLKSPMADGMERSYKKLDELLDSTEPRGA